MSWDNILNEKKKSMEDEGHVRRKLAGPKEDALRDSSQVSNWWWRRQQRGEYMKLKSVTANRGWLKDIFIFQKSLQMPFLLCVLQTVTLLDRWEIAKWGGSLRKLSRVPPLDGLWSALIEETGIKQWDETRPSRGKEVDKARTPLWTRCSECRRKEVKWMFYRWTTIEKMLFVPQKKGVITPIFPFHIK